MPEMLLEDVDALRTDALGEIFAWRVSTDAFVDASICEGDILIVRRVTEIADGDMIMFGFEGRRCIRRARHIVGDYWQLETAEGSERPEMFAHRDNIQLDGKVIAIIRHL